MARFLPCPPNWLSICRSPSTTQTVSWSGTPSRSSLINHELRTPLNATLDFAQRLSTDAAQALSSDQAEAALQRVHADAELLE